jgi:glycosyltransferase involved in cell wall biosynthesis
MFKFTVIPYEFYSKGDMGGPLIQSNLLAKWLSELCPPDLEIAFAPVKEEKPYYTTKKLKLVRPENAAGWKHYLNDNHWQGKEPQRCSFGPSLVLQKEGRIGIVEKYNIPLVTVSEYSKSQVLEGWDYASDNVHPIPTIVDPAFRPGKKANNTTVGWIGYDYPDRWVKGAELIPYLAEMFPQIQFEMVFGMEPRYQSEWMPRKYPNVKIYTKVKHSDMPKLIRRWHVLACGSKHEAGPNHVAEAMACGVPVICGNVSSLPEVAKGQTLVDDVKKWYKYPYDWTKDSLEKFSLALGQLLGDSALYRSKIEAAVEKSKDHLPQVVAQRWFDFIYTCRQRTRD